MAKDGFPKLRKHEGSWVVTFRNGQITEFFTESNARKAYDAGLKVETINTYLARINASLRGQR